MKRAWLVLPLLFLGGCKRAAPELSLRVEQPGSGTAARIVVSAPDARFWGRLADAAGQVRNAAAALQVRPLHEGVADWEIAAEKGSVSPALFGSWAVSGREWSFSPAMPLRSAQSYVITLDPSTWGIRAENGVSYATGNGPVASKGKIHLLHRVPTAFGSGLNAVTTLSIHPTSSALPANHLKFYLTFSQPMEQGVFLDRVRLRRADGSEVIGPFRETELWSPDGRRLTLWLHPGRQKTGVNLNEDEGAVLHAGETVMLVISGQWRAANGQPLGRDLTRTYQVGPADHVQPDLQQWTLTAPKRGTREPLRIAFPEPLDWALLQNSLAITDARPQSVSGDVEVADGEREWRFTPAQAWLAGDYQLAVDGLLEDLAGNNLDRLFETETSAGQAAASSAKAHHLTFTIE